LEVTTEREKMDKKELCEVFALGNVLSDYPRELSYDDLWSALSENTMPEGVVVWLPFEEHEPQVIAEFIAEQYEMLSYFAEKLESLTKEKEND
jgi:hypothetical protein